MQLIPYFSLPNTVILIKNGERKGGKKINKKGREKGQEYTTATCVN